MQGKSWVGFLSAGDYDQLWHALFNLVSKHPSIRRLYAYSRISPTEMVDVYADFTQEVFLKIFEKGRWQFYLDSAYEDSDIEHELCHFEIPNLVGMILRERYPEAFRISRRVVNLLRSSKNYKRYNFQAHSLSGESGAIKPVRGLGKHFYGLSSWPLDKPVKSPDLYAELIKDVPSRNRDIKKAGCSSTSQIIISNAEMDRLITDIFRAIDSPLEVRSIRTLVQSKLLIEDSSFTPIYVEMMPAQRAESAPLRVELADTSPTPEDIVLLKDSSRQMDSLAEDLLEKLKAEVNYKTNRYTKILRVVWHCYFDNTAPSQRSIAVEMGVSDSLISYYRKIFDDVIKTADIGSDEWVLLIASLKNQIALALNDHAKSQDAKPLARAKICTVSA